MITYPQPIDQVHKLSSHFNRVLEPSDWTEWKKDYASATWQRERTLQAIQSTTVLFRLITQEPGRDEGVYALRSQGVLLGEAEGHADRTVKLTQTELHAKRLFSRRIGEFVATSWRFSTSTVVGDAPEIVMRELSPEEQERHEMLGISQEPTRTVDIPRSVDLTLGYDYFSWYIRDSDPDRTRLNPKHQVGGIVVANLYDTVMEVMPDPENISGVVT